MADTPRRTISASGRSSKEVIVVAGIDRCNLILSVSRGLADVPLELADTASAVYQDGTSLCLLSDAN